MFRDWQREPGICEKGKQPGKSGKTRKTEPDVVRTDLSMNYGFRSWWRSLCGAEVLLKSVPGNTQVVREIFQLVEEVEKSGYWLPLNFLCFISVPGTIVAPSHFPSPLPLFRAPSRHNHGF